MRQRLGLAEILMKDARIAILDEPTYGLDPHATIELLEMIRSLKPHGVGVLLSSHLLERVQSVCDRVALFNAGRIALMGTVPSSPARCSAAAMTSRSRPNGDGLAKRLSAMPGVRSVEHAGARPLPHVCDRDLRAEAAAAVVAAGGRLKQLSLDEPSLDTIYTRYFQKPRSRTEAHHAA